MKKIFMVTLFAVLSCVTLQNTANAKNCKPVNCDTSSGNDKIGAENMELYGGGDSDCYICEQGYCENGDIVADANFKKFKLCVQSSAWNHDDTWVDYNPKKCNDMGNVEAMSRIKGTKKVYRIEGSAPNSYGTTAFGGGVVSNGQAICYYYECMIEGTVPDISKGACVVEQPQNNGGNNQNNGGNNQNNGGNNQNNGGNKPTCRSQRTSDEGKACCDLPPEAAVWKNQQCICTGGKEFKINNGRGTCVAPENDDVPFRCTDVDISLFNQWTVQCASHSATINLIKQIQTLCKSPSLTAAQYNQLYTQVATSVVVNCQQTVVQPEPEPEPVIDNNSKNKIIAAGKVLDGIAAGFDVSVWKNAQGEFNTARLASDSIAGVVLGTVGGVVTSSVMKKHQVEDGFEDLKCTIGGQPVAGWGDEFNVGVQ